MKHLTYKNIIFLMAISCLFLAVPPLANGSSRLKVSVEIIKAERNSKSVDPDLKDLVEELSTVLNYTGFSLIKKALINLKLDEINRITLPSGRTLDLHFLGFDGQQARLSVIILENGTETFRTVVLLVPKGSLLIGGPPYEQGVLLLRIEGQF